MRTKVDGTNFFDIILIEIDFQFLYFYHAE